MIDFTQGIDLANSLLEQSLAKAVEPYRIMPSRLGEDIEALRLQLTSAIWALSPEQLASLFTLVLCLKGYGVNREDAYLGHRYWVTEVQNPDGISYFGIAALVEKPDDVAYYRACMIRLGYVSGVLCMVEAEPVSNPLPSAVVLTDRSYISQLLFTLAVHDYAENVMELAVATATDPSFRQAVQAALVQHLLPPWDAITAASERWATLRGSRT